MCPPRAHLVPSLFLLFTLALPLGHREVASLAPPCASCRHVLPCPKPTILGPSDSGLKPLKHDFPSLYFSLLLCHSDRKVTTAAEVGTVQQEEFHVCEMYLQNYLDDIFHQIILELSSVPKSELQHKIQIGLHGTFFSKIQNPHLKSP